MKRMKLNLFLAMTAIALSACNKDDVNPASEGNPNGIPSTGEMATIQLEMDAPAFTSALESRALSQKYDIKDLRIMAFRQNDAGKFMYLQEVPKDNIQLNGDKFTGKALLPVGVYKFIPAFGIPAATDANVNLSPINTTVEYSDDLAAAHVTTGKLPAIFLQNDDVNVQTYSLRVNSDDNYIPVKLATKRAVARLDVIIVRADKTTNPDNTVTYAEKDGFPVFGDAGLTAMKLEFTGINSAVRLTKGNLTGAAKIDHTFNVNINEAVTNGSGSAMKYGTEGYDYEKILPGDFFNGAAHIYGPFVFPYENNETGNLAITLTSDTDPNTNQVYTRTIKVSDLVLKRNEITVIKVYVPGDNTDVYHTNVDVEVSIQKGWDKLNTSFGEAE